eukprot:6851098-Prymnesium_polylepis.1
MLDTDISLLRQSGMKSAVGEERVPAFAMRLHGVNEHASTPKLSSKRRARPSRQRSKRGASHRAP